MPGVDFIFHAAALKQVPSCEFFPMEAVQTNVEVTNNVLHAAIDAKVKRVVCLSTDKAAYPINAIITSWSKNVLPDSNIISLYFNRKSKSPLSDIHTKWTHLWTTFA